MELPVRQVNNAQQEIAEADYPNIHLFTVQRKVAVAPQADCVGSWTICSPQTIAGFSAVGYFFGRQLHKELGVPIGLINTSWGGTLAEAWTSNGALSQLEDFKAVLEEIEQVRANPEPYDKKYQEQMQQWQKKVDPSTLKDSAGKDCTDLDYNDSGWGQMELPVFWEQAGLEGFDGLVWFRSDVNVPETWVGKALVLELGPIDDMDVTWVNSVRVGGIERAGQYGTARRYKISPNVVKAGRNAITVRVLDTGGDGGIYGKPEQMRLRPADAPAEKGISLAGKWRYKKSFDLQSIPPQPSPPLRVDNANAPTALYNGMIAPLIPYSVRGAIWYQGESNASRASQYRRLFPTMIQNWRQDWRQGDFPFLFAQLANYMAARPEPSDSAWAELREAQLMTLTLPNTGMAVIIDTGDANDIHPRNKQDVGKRLALWALAKTYGKDIVYSGPLYKSMRVESSKIILSFDHVGGGLLAGGSKLLKGFAIAGADRKFIWADAKIEGNTVVVSSDKITEPVAVRYAWADNPACNLYNKEGLPASPFRTDDWLGITANK
jgi:sialate O-acetylesterase